MSSQPPLVSFPSRPARVEAGTPPASRHDRLRNARRVRRARRRRRLLLLAVVVVSLAALSWGLVGVVHRHLGRHGVAVTAMRILPPELAPSLGRVAADPGKVAALPFPAAGEAAVAVMGSGVVAASPHEKPEPIASVTKLMTAYLVLRAHPLVGEEQGPSLHFTLATHLAWLKDAESDESNLELVRGETLTERQLLEALLIPSADNVADIFAKWVSGSEARFVALMNATAASLGLRETHYADASGVDPHSVSTAADQAELASVLMANPVVRSIVSLTHVVFPVAGQVWNYNPALGVDGIVGVKSGFTDAAGGCLATAAWRDVSGRRLLVIAVVTGQPLGLDQAATADESLLDATTSRLRIFAPYGTETVAARVLVPWTRRRYPATIAEPVVLAGLGGLRLAGRIVGTAVTAAELRHGWSAGSVVGELELSSQFGPVTGVPVTLSRSIPPPPKGSVGLRPDMTLRVAT